MHVHLWCCFPEGKEPFRHTPKEIFGLGDKIDMLKEIDVYGGVVFDSQGQCFPIFFFLPISPSHSPPFLPLISHLNRYNLFTGQFLKSSNFIHVVHLYHHTLHHQETDFFKHYMNKMV